MADTIRTPSDKPGSPPPAKLDDELERERLELGLNTDGTGDVGADPARSKPGGNSNT